MFTRRLILGTALSALTTSGLQARISPSARYFTIVLQGIRPGMTKEDLYEILTPFLAAGLPVSIEISAEAWEGYDRNDGRELWDFLDQASHEYPGFINIFQTIAERSEQSPYFQARAVYDAARQLTDLPSISGKLTRQNQVVSATLAADMIQENMSGYRVAGLRNLVTGPSKNSRSQFVNSIEITPGVSYSESVTEIQLKIADHTSETKDFALLIDLEYILGYRSESLDLAAKRITEQCQRLFLAQGLQPVLASDLHLQRNPGYAQRIFLLAEPDSSQTPLTSMLRTENLPLLTQITPQEFDVQQIDPNGIQQHKIASLITYLTSTDTPAHSGINTQGIPVQAHRLRPQTAADVENLPSDCGEKADCVIDLRALPGNNQGLHQKALQTLRAMTQTPTRIFVTEQQLPNMLLPDDPVYDAFFDEMIFRTQTKLDPTPPVPVERTALQQDAAHAWKYILQREHPMTGLCPTTVFSAGDRSYLHRQATMWDVGSLLFGLDAGFRLNLLNENDFEARVRRVIDALPAVSLQGMLLPPSVIATNTGRALKQEFNSCDCARLLSAFRHLMRHPGLQDLIERKLAGWDLADTIFDNAPQNIDTRRKTSTYASHCSHYSRRAFGHFGVAHGSPYLPRNTDWPVADQRMSVLMQAAEIGVLGAEPLLLEHVEFGDAPDSGYLARVLFTQQWLHYMNTGQLTATSEAPVNRAPWFIYEGLNLLSDQTRWSIDLVAGRRQYRDEDLKNQFSMLNSKAAYLWHATHPNAYTQAMITRIREDMEGAENGFAPGLYHSTGRPDVGFADLNTNAVILQAICFRLGA